MRTIDQPGPAPAERAVTVPVATVPIDADLPAGWPLLDALHAAMAEAGSESACLRLAGGALGPFAYVIPAPSPDADHAAFYSDTFRPVGQTALETAAVTVGWRDDAPFFHVHGIWIEADGKRHGGHVLPEGTTIARPIRASGVGLLGARFEARQDPETGFKLFEPVATRTTPAEGAAAGLALRLRPNQDITAALEGLSRDAGFARAVLLGGVGSIVGARYVDAPPIEAFATEMLVRRGDIRGTATTGPATCLDVAMVDLTGRLSGGLLVAGDNPILMTLEGVLLRA